MTSALGTLWAAACSYLHDPQLSKEKRSHAAAGQLQSICIACSPLRTYQRSLLYLMRRGSWTVQSGYGGPVPPRSQACTLVGRIWSPRQSLGSGAPNQRGGMTPGGMSA